MNSHFVHQQTNERIGSMMREAAASRLAKQAEKPRQARVLPLLQTAQNGLGRLVHFLNPMHRAPRTAKEQL